MFNLSLLEPKNFQGLLRPGRRYRVKRFISENINDIEFVTGRLNLITSGTGTGKSEFVRNGLLDRFPDIEPSEILYVTSRSMTKDQQSMKDGISKFTQDDEDVVCYWNKEIESLKKMSEAGIWILHYNDLARIIDFMCPREGLVLQRIKVAVFDECHAIYSDNFIPGMAPIRVWIRERVLENRMILIGLTATPDIMFYYSGGAGIKTCKVNAEDFVNYRAKHLICVSNDKLKWLFGSGRLEGASMIMCQTISDCIELQKKLSNSVIIYSKYNSTDVRFSKEENKEMNRIRDYIIRNNRLPPTSNDEPLNILITTTTMREGVNLIEESGIKNVISFIPDELHIKQFAGRCRYDVDNLIVVYKPKHLRTGDYDGYITKSRLLFRDYVYDQRDRRWFDTIKDIVDCDFEDIERFGLDRDTEQFCDEFDARWLCDMDLPKEERDKYRLMEAKDREWVISLAIQCKLLDIPQTDYTFNAVTKYMENELEYIVATGKTDNKVDGRKTYKLFFKEN